MNNISWEKVLEIQQEDFIKRLKAAYYPVQLSATPLSIFHCGEPDLFPDQSCERIDLNLDRFQDLKINEFSNELAEDEDSYMNHMIGKIGEESLKVYLGSNLSPVDYEVRNGGDGGVDFVWKFRTDISIQVKTRILGRIKQPQIEAYTNSDIFDMAHFVLRDKPNEFIDDMYWNIKPEEKEKNKILVCILLMNFAYLDQMVDSVHSCIMAGFKPTNMITHDRDLKLDQLFYIGGLRAYLQSLE